MQIAMISVSFLVLLLILLLGCQSLPYSNQGRRQTSSKSRYTCHNDQVGVSLTDSEIQAPIDTSSGATKLKTGNKRYGEDNFGDIMIRDNIGCETDISISSECSSIERMILTANGNLQRIMSAYYGCPIKVNVLRSKPISRGRNEEGISVTYDREVDLLVNDRKFCNAVTKV